MKIVVTGAGGQLGQEFIDLLSDKYELYGFKKDELDITDRNAVRFMIKDIKPQFIINCAAMTDTDRCEVYPEDAFSVNRDGVRNLAEAAKNFESILVHFSSDLIFPGDNVKPYTEEDVPRPVNFYGKSKLAGEKEIQKISNEYYIIRTSWLYSRNGKNFVNSILELSRKNRHFVVVEDQIGSPTFTRDVVMASEVIINSGKYGIYNCVNKGECSRFAFAEKIFKEANISGIKVMPAATDEFKTEAKRPRYAALSNKRLEGDLGYKMESWEEALRERFRS